MTFAAPIPHVDTPTPGHYKMKLVKGGPWVPVRIWHGPPADPLTGELLERSWRFQAEISGSEAEIGRVWPWCAANPIPESEYRYFLATHRWAVDHAPDAPEASPRTPIDLHKMPTLF